MLIFCMDALLVIDLQNCVRSYDPDKYSEYIDSANSAIESTCKLIDATKQHDIDLIIIAYSPKKELIFEDGPVGLVPEIKQRLTPESFIFTKTEPSAARAVQFDNDIILKDHLLSQNYKNIYLAGGKINDCIQHTIDDLNEVHELGKLVIIRDCCEPSAKLTGGQAAYFSQRNLCSSSRLREHYSTGKPLSYIPFNLFAKKQQTCKYSGHTPIETLRTHLKQCSK